MATLRSYRSDLFAVLFLFILPILWFLPVLFPGISGLTLLPYDNLYSFEPWRSLRPDLIPHNNLLSDLVLENAVWKQHINQTLADGSMGLSGRLPMWNPQILTGLPFFAAGQASVLYPLSILFYVLPLETAYGWFTALQIALAGINTYIFCRTLRLRPLAALFSGVVFMFSGFLIVSVVFTMFLAAVVWLPLLLAIIETVIRKQEEKGNVSFRPVPYIVAGSIVIGLVVLAGHPELIYYTMIVAGLYSLVRLVILGLRISNKGLGWGKRVVALASWLLTMALLGVGIGAVQLIPLMELLPYNFREGSASFRQVLEWAWPSRHVVSFFLPDVFGNPSHHQWFDIWNRTWEPATVNALGEPVDTIFWGIKNYVEGGSYLGIVTWILAVVAVFGQGIRDKALGIKPLPNASLTAQVVEGTVVDDETSTLHRQPSTNNHRLTTFFFAGLALVSLLFAFGTPLYGILYYGLPGWSQLHSPFRWVFPFTLSMAVLAGIGLEIMSQATASQTVGRWSVWAQGPASQTVSRWAVSGGRWLAVLTALAGLGALAVALISVVMPEPFIGLGQRLVESTDLVQMAFADGRMFWSYQAMNLVRFGVFALLSGLSVWFLTSPQPSSETGGSMTRRLIPDSRSLIPFLLILLVLADLYVAHGNFNPASPVALSPLNPENQPPVVQFMEERHQNQEGVDLWRFTTFNIPGEKTLSPNVGMYYGWHDIRGYDSVIPKQYAELMGRIAPQGDLLYNQIAPLYSNVSVYDILNHPLLDLLNVRYLLSEHAIPNPEWQEIYRDESIGVYENAEVMPRAFVVNEAVVAAPEEQPLAEANLAQTVFIEAAPHDENALVSSSPELAEANLSTYAANGLFVDLNLSDRGWLVVTDAYFPGWKAFLRPFGAGEDQEIEVPIYRANSAFRTVYIPENGQWTVRFAYAPMSFRLGLYVSFLALMTGLLLLAWWGWGRYYRPDGDSDVQRVAKNSLVPIILSLSNKAIDFAFAMLYVRLLGPEGTGKYFFVVGIYGLFEIVSRYGLGTLVTRDVAADKSRASRYLTNTIALRTLLWLAVVPLISLVVYGYQVAEQIQPSMRGIDQDEIIALALLTVAMLFANWSDSFSSLFMAYEKMEYTSGFANAAVLFKVALGALVLLLGWGFIGLAGISLLVNFLQMFCLFWLVRSVLFKPEWQWDWSLQKWMMSTSGPLMINHLLATIFWRIDIWILGFIGTSVGIGLYSLGIKYLDGINIIPSMFTMAIFPLMSRFARSAEGNGESVEGQNPNSNLLRSYILSTRILLIISLPIALTMTVLAVPLVALVGGSEFLGMTDTVNLFGRTLTYSSGSDMALRIIIWSIPIGFVNSVTQYVLIAVNQQRYLTKAFIIGVVFNTVGNLLTIPTFGYLGAAAITGLSEFSLFFPFYYSVRQHVGRVPWLAIFAPPIISMAIAAAVVYFLSGQSVGLSVQLASGLLIYAVALVVTGAFRGEDMAVVARALPFGPMRRLLRVGA